MEEAKKAEAKAEIFLSKLAKTKETLAELKKSDQAMRERVSGFSSRLRRSIEVTICNNISHKIDKKPIW